MTTRSGEKTDGRPLATIFRESAERLERETNEMWERRHAESLAALRGNPLDEDARFQAVHALRKLNRHAEAIELLRAGLLPSATVRAHHQYAGLLEQCNRTEEAIAAAAAGLRAFPGDVSLRLKEALALPVLYDSAGEIDRWRGRFAGELARLRREIRLDSPERRRNALLGIGGHTNFHLGYQARNDKDLQVQYGELAHRIMAANYPEWARPLGMPPAARQERLRVGYVSGRFCDRTATRYFLGWLREHDRERFAVHVWHLGRKTDSVTEEARRISFRFDHVPGRLEDACRGIRERDLHILVFLDIGLDPIMTQLAALRLAPVQCMAWDQPITSGLPTVDYFLSGSLAEPEAAAEHYSERLVRLPGVGVCYRRAPIPIPLLTLTRRDFRLREDAAVFLCCQGVYKFLPQNDCVLAEIARRVPHAQFVFTVTNPMAGADMEKRLARAFADAGLRAADHCVLLPQLVRRRYWNLHRVADVFLDTIGWSSAVSTFEAVACRVPVVTLPGDLMRSRQAGAILSQLEVPDTIARDRAGYVEIAVRLAVDRGFRAGIVERMKGDGALLYNDRRPVTALEAFFRSACAAASAGAE